MRGNSPGLCSKRLGQFLPLSHVLGLTVKINKRGLKMRGLLFLKEAYGSVLYHILIQSIEADIL